MRNKHTRKGNSSQQRKYRVVGGTDYHDMRAYDPNGLDWSPLELPRYVAWRYEVRDGKRIKPPRTKNGYASVTDPRTWATRKEAEKWEDGKIGYVLGEVEEAGEFICGMDLDGCLDESTAEITDNTARAIVTRFDTYTEVSPSDKGLHLLFVMSWEDARALKSQAIANRGGHRGIALDIEGRYYTLTGNWYERRRPIRCVTLADIEWAKSLVPQKAKKRDESDSGYGFRFMQARKREGDTYEQALGTLKANKGRAGDWYSKWQNDPGCERQLHRAWDEFEDGTDEEWKIEHSREFMRGFVPPDYLLDGVLQRHFFYSITAQTNGGKTAVLLLIAAKVALGGGQFCGRNLQGGRVLYLAGENADDVRMRWMAMAHRMDFDPESIDLHFIKTRPDLRKNLAEIKRQIEAIGDFVLVIIDTAAAYFKGNENSNKEAGDFARLLRRLTELCGGPTVIVACHPTKYATEDELTPRGGGAFMF